MARFAEIRKILSDSNLFLEKDLDTIQEIRSRPNTAKTISIPQPTGVTQLDSTDGLALKDEVGYVEIREVLDKQEKLEGYIYKFVAKDYQVVTKSGKHNEEKILPLIFHFDKTLNNGKHNPHLTVIYPDIRYEYGKEEVKLQDFLMCIRKNFYKGDTRFTAKTSPIWNNCMF